MSSISEGYQNGITGMALGGWLNKSRLNYVQNFFYNALKLKMYLYIINLDILQILIYEINGVTVSVLVSSAADHGF